MVAPTVTAVSPNSGSVLGGGFVNLSGTGFSVSPPLVQFGSSGPYAQQVTVLADTSLSCDIPAAANIGAVNILVTTTNGTSAAASGNVYTYTAPLTDGIKYTVPNYFFDPFASYSFYGPVSFFGNVIGVSQATQVYIPTITGQAGAVSVLFSAPFAGKLTSVAASISGAITGSNIVITPSIYHAGTGTAVTGGVVTIPFAGSGVGTSDIANPPPTAGNTFVAGDTITATITGGTGSVNGVITILVTRTA